MRAESGALDHAGGEVRHVRFRRSAAELWQVDLFVLVGDENRAGTGDQRTDEVVPFEQSERLAADLSRLGVSYEAHFFAGMSHYLLADRPSADLDRLYAITVDFLRRVQN